MRRRIWPIIASAVLGCAILIALGVWQVERLQWKQALLADLDRRAAAEPVALSAALGGAPEDIDYLKVTASGRFAPGAELRMIASHHGRPAWHLLRAFLSEQKIAVLVDRGIVPQDMPAGDSRPAPEGRTTLTGVLKRHDARAGLFAPSHDEANNVWYAWDIPAMLAAADVPADHRIAPFVLHATHPAEGYPAPTPLRADLRNNHLGYAITWFGLAVALAVMAVVFARQQMRRG